MKWPRLAVTQEEQAEHPVNGDGQRDLGWTTGGGYLGHPPIFVGLD